MSASGRAGGGACGRRLRERARPPLLARAQPAIPDFDHLLEARLQHLEPEAIGGAGDVAAVVPLDQRLDPAARLPRRPRQPAGEEHVVFRLEPLDVRGERQQVLLEVGQFGHVARRQTSPDQEPDQRQPQLARVRHRPIVDEHVGRVEAPDDLEQVAQLDGVLRIEPRAVPQRRARRAPRGTRPRRAPAPARARSRPRRTSGNSIETENGSGDRPNSASASSGLSRASSSSVGCSGRSTYGQNRSTGR